MLNIKDSEQLEDHIEQLWNDGVDAVYIGGGEQELCIVNPKCAVTGRGETFAVFNMNVRDPSDEDLLKIWNSREEKLKEVEGIRKQNQDAKSEEKRKNLEEYEKTKELFYKSLEEYKEDKLNFYKMRDIYQDFSMKALRAIKHMDQYEAKKKLKEIVLTKPIDKYRANEIS
jgi:ABC-type sugar transport system ATPase subunit